jgi:hypothetical protein
LDSFRREEALGTFFLQVFIHGCGFSDFSFDLNAATMQDRAIYHDVAPNIGAGKAAHAQTRNFLTTE